MRTPPLPVVDPFPYFTEERYERNRYAYSMRRMPPTTVLEYRDGVNVPAEVAEWIRRTFAYASYDPLSPYPFSKSVPSPRGIHPFVPVFSAGGNRYVYDAGRDRFAFVGRGGRENRFSLCIDLFRVCGVYGEFGFPLALMECGHILADLYPSVKRGRFTFRNHNEMHPLAPFRKGDLIEFYEGELPVSIESGWDDIGEDGVGIQDDFVQELHFLGMERWMSRAASVTPSIPTLPGTMEGRARGARTSFNGRLGLFARPSVMEGMTFARLLEIAGRYEALSMTFFVQSVDGMEKGVYRMESGGPKRMGGFESLNDLFYEGKRSMNLDGLPLAIILSVRNGELASFIHAHVLAGMCVQEMSAAFSGEGRFTRPFKNINDAYLKQTGESKLYGCLFGSGTSATRQSWR
ncbi:hypothetical protein [Rossellomorea marisflavi]|uniref:hypothetical protein n=1 Tax=Rossellomorea marisflavi TaxID=189381 RepID=UPI001EE2C589|nr:hypothetical protein [Rossellomorea marisflavi]UKS65933.1 hypothetical protein K6T23_03420 [Rossellomorea marisflavi]